MNKHVTNGILILITGVIVFFLMQALVTDIIDEGIEEAITTESLTSATTINYIVALFTLVMFFAFGLVSAVVYRTAEAGVMILLSMAFTMVIVYIVAGAGLYSITGFTLDVNTFLLIPALFIMYVLGNPAYYIVFLVTTFIVINTSFNMLARVDVSE